MKNPEYDKEDVLGYECKHAIYTKGISQHRGGIPDDLIFIKEVVHLKDGRKIPHTRMKMNYQRPFWITKPGFRNHQEKKEWEDIDRLKEFKTTQAGLNVAIKKALDIRSAAYGLKQLARNPYLYGADITPTALIKRQYMEKWPDLRTENTLAVLDLETDVLVGHEDPIYGSVTFKEKAILAVTKEYLDRCKAWAGTYEEYVQQQREHFYKRIPEDVQVRNIDLEVQVVDTAVDLIRILIQRCHEWKPDFLSVWNINFDIPRILKTLEKYNVDPGDIFSDPSVPHPFRKCWYKQGPSKKVTANGKEEALHWVDQWHTFYCPASFYLVDQACVFRKLRVASGREPSYGLDAILKKYANTKKLKNEKADTMSGLEWHIYMQESEPLEYGVYNVIDCVGCEILDEQPAVGDLRLSISMQTGHSDYDKFPSQPRRTVDDLHFTCIENGKIIGTTPDVLKTEYDSMTTSIKGWIVTLPAHLVEENGICCVQETPDLRSLVRVAVYDLDLKAAYPNGEDLLNCSKETTVAEVIKIKGVTEEVRRLTGINLTAGTVNATEILCSVCKAPTFDDLLIDFEENELGRSTPQKAVA